MPHIPLVVTSNVADGPVEDTIVLDVGTITTVDDVEGVIGGNGVVLVVEGAADEELELGGGGGALPHMPYCGWQL